MSERNLQILGWAGTCRRGEFPGDHLWATNRNNGALNRAFSGLINFKIARAAFKSAEFK